MFASLSRSLRYLVALAVVLIAFGARFLLKSILGDVEPLLLFSLSIVLASWDGGLGPGLFATLISAFMGEYYFIEPLYTFQINRHSLPEQVELFLFLCFGMAVSALSQARLSSEAKRQQLLVSEQKARREAEAANRLKDEFLAMVTHELRNPLTAILGWAVLLRSGRLDQAKTGQALESIERNTRIQERLIGDLLDMSRLMSAKLQMVSELVSLKVVIEAAVDVVRTAADAKGVQLRLALDPMTERVQGDPTRLQQVVWNLLSNAVKFTPAGGLVQVTLDRVDSKAQIMVKDTGRGISPEFLPYVFDRFRQADSKSGGLGLGLAITQSLVEMHNGSIEAYSAGEGQGATFKVCIPISPPPPV